MPEGDRAAVRRAWHCDCDGRSHATPLRVVASTGVGAVAGRMAAGVGRITGVAPTSCPWRAYGDPVAQAALVLSRRVEAGVVMLDEQLAVVVDAMDAIDSARGATEAVDRRAEREKREAQRRADAAKNS